MYAIIKTGGKQYKVMEGDNIYIEKLDIEAGESVDFEEVLFVNKDGELTIGAPFVENAKVKATILEHGRGKKVIVAKYKPKKTYFRKRGHRQPYTKVTIDSIEA